MKVLIADKFPHHAFERLSAMGHNVDLQPALMGPSLMTELPDVEVLVVRSTQVTGEMMVSANQLRLIVRAGAGTNAIDKATAHEHGIYVCNVPGRNANAVAELTMGLLISIDRRIPDNVAALRAGRWDKKAYSLARGLYGRRMGIIGLGATGCAVAQRALAFGMQVYGIDRPGRINKRRSEIEALGIKIGSDLATMVEHCDIVSFHVPSTDITRGMINSEFLSSLMPGTIILNLSRGDLVNENALIEAIESKQLFVGLDVYQNEPTALEGPFDSPLARHANVYGTHHIGASTAEAQDAVAAGVVEVIDQFVKGHLVNCVSHTMAN